MRAINKKKQQQNSTTTKTAQPISHRQYDQTIIIQHRQRQTTIHSHGSIPFEIPRDFEKSDKKNIHSFIRFRDFKNLSVKISIKSRPFQREVRTVGFFLSRFSEYPNGTILSFMVRCFLSLFFKIRFDAFSASRHRDVSLFF